MRLLCAALLLLAFTTAAPAAEAPLRVAVDAQYPPFGYIGDDGVLAGFDVDIAKALCAELKRECAITGVPFDDILPGIVRGDVDIAVAGLGRTPERENMVDFTNRYYRSHSIFIEAEGTDAAISAEGLAGKSIGVLSGSAQEEYLRRAFPTSTVTPHPTLEEIMTDLKAGKTYVALVEGLPGFAYLKTPEGGGLETVGPPIQEPMLAGPSAIAVSKKLPQLTQSLNEAIETIRRNGEYARINRKYFDFNIY